MNASLFATSIFVVLTLLNLASPHDGMASALFGYHPPPRLLAIGDLHGDITNAKEILKFAQIVDCEGKWIAGHDTVIQVGDVVDRGPHGHEIIDYFTTLKEDARQSGGEFIQLLGNHELMNMQGNMKFANAQTVTAFGGMESLKQAFDPITGAYGTYLTKTCDAAVLRNRTLFVHAGVLPQYAHLGVAELNRQVRNAILAKNISDPILLDDGPLWTRQIIYPAQKGNCSNLYESLKILSEYETKHGRKPVDRMVIGHTIMQDGAIHQFCDGKLIAIDIAISQYMASGGRQGILELRYDFATHTDIVTPYIQYPSQPFRQHALPAVMFPKRIPVPPFEAKEKGGVQGAALTIRTYEDSMTKSELVLLCIAFFFVAGLVASQRVKDGGKGLFSLSWLGGRRRKLEHAA
ncbi:serine-threonine protein phosphatase, putative [Bodo saltans]|uniref:Serine-threonine protein phosphatase, putative n=1 Tax=Bodo saltans TaxID=75058 RepID=A0A0S4JMN0_BODSA|nr:serine-threonine protein phosphatase, putative [Bodo saltans]|eukprot:CUG90543.1 serine-threonine protein phosphatase, putative [Bodo saltans]